MKKLLFVPLPQGVSLSGRDGHTIVLVPVSNLLAYLKGTTPLPRL